LGYFLQVVCILKKEAHIYKDTVSLTATAKIIRCHSGREAPIAEIYQAKRTTKKESKETLDSINSAKKKNRVPGSGPKTASDPVELGPGPGPENFELELELDNSTGSRVFPSKK